MSPYTVMSPSPLYAGVADPEPLVFELIEFGTLRFRFLPFWGFLVVYCCLQSILAYIYYFETIIHLTWLDFAVVVERKQRRRSVHVTLVLDSLCRFPQKPQQRCRTQTGSNETLLEATVCHPGLWAEILPRCGLSVNHAVAAFHWGSYRHQRKPHAQSMTWCTALTPSYSRNSSLSEGWSKCWWSLPCPLSRSALGQHKLPYTIKTHTHTLGFACCVNALEGQRHIFKSLASFLNTHQP